MSIITVKDEYYQQWQLMPGVTEKWQADTSQLEHPGRKRVAELVLANSKSVLDVACGVGVDYHLFYKDNGIKYMGIDVTEKFIDVAKSNGVPCMMANALKLPFPDKSFDSVICKDLLLHLPPNAWRTVLSEMARVAKKQVVILDDAWQQGTIYMIREKYAALDPESKQIKELMFFNNIYGMHDVLTYASELGLTVQVYPGMTVKKVVPEGGSPDTYERSQITVYTKN